MSHVLHRLFPSIFNGCHSVPAAARNMIATYCSAMFAAGTNNRGRGVHRPEIPSLTGLRFYAAALVLWSHSVGAFFVPAKVPVLANTVATGPLGMTLFVLSGFVIHYNYGASVSTHSARSLYAFGLARFARLYPLFFLCVVISMAMPREPSPAVAETWLFYLTMTHDWFPRVFDNIMLGDLFAPASWSISAEVFLYLVYMAIARPVDRLLRMERTIIRVGSVFVVLVSLFHLGRLAGLWYTANDQWLFYRSPFCRISEFTLGVLVAAFYNVRNASVATAEERRVAALLAVIGAAWIVFLLVAGALPSTQDQALMLQYSWGFAPSVGALIYFLARCKSPLSWWVENKGAILLGEASYSIYLLHWVFLWVFMSSGVSTNQLLVPKIALAWLMTGLLALGCYRYFEWPMRVFLRRALALRARAAVSVATPAPSFDPARSSSG
jgi:peptidoglycan/LPS O-acetylase OafA/YrhL